jgi:hypothetical protein
MNNQPHLTARQAAAIARARRALEAERAGVLPDYISPDTAQAFWRGWLRQALTGLIEQLSEDEGGQS